MAVSDYFVWGGGGQKLTPQQLEQRRQVEEALLAKGVDTSPVGHWTQGLARVADAAAGSFRRGRLEKQEGELKDYQGGLRTKIADLLSGGSSASSSIPMTSAAGEVAATAPVSSSGPQSYRDAIASIESAGSGDYSAIGPTNDKLGRALGRYQIMEANIGPWSQAALGRAVTPDEFLASPEIQDAIFDKQFGQYVEQFGPEGAAQAWFAGPGGVGKTERQDVLGTNVGEYGSRFMQSLGNAPAAAAIDSAAPVIPPVDAATQPMPAQSPVEVAGGGGRPLGNINPAIIEALTDPRADEGTRRIAALLVEQEQAKQAALADQQTWMQRQQYEAQQQAADPMRQLQLDEQRLKVDAMRNPQPKIPDSVQALNIRAQQAGLQPGTPEYRDFMISGGNKGITVDARQMGNIPPGYKVDYDAEGRPISMSPILGSPASIEAEQVKRTIEKGKTTKETAANIVTQDIDRAFDAMDNASLPTTGLIGDVLSNVPGTAARDVSGLVTTIKANATFDKLQAMRESSPTGGALGAVSDTENRLLASAIGNLEQSQGDQQFRDNLARVQNIYLDIIHGPGNGPDRRELSFEQKSGKRASPSGNRAEKPISDMTDEELEALANGN